MSNRPRRSTTPTQEAALAGAATFLVLWLTRTRDVGGDDTVFAMAVEGWLRGRGAAAELFDAYHPIHNPLVAALAWVVRLVFPGALVLDVGATISALFAGLTVGVLVWLLRREGHDSLVALLAAATVGACGGMWSIGTRMEVYTIAAAAVAVWLACIRAARPRALHVGLSLAGALLAHLALGLLVLPTAWRLRRSPRELLIAVGTGLGIPGLTLLGIFTLVRGVWSPLGWFGMLVPQETLDFVQPGNAASMPRALYGLVLWNWYRRVPVLTPAADRIMDVVGVCALLLAVVLAGAGIVAALRETSRLTRCALLGIAAFLPLWLFWDVGNPEHAVAAAPLFGVLLAAGASRFPRPWTVAALGLLLLSLLLVNGVASAVPQSRPENGRLWVTAGFVTEHVPPGAVVLALGTDPQVRLGLGYLAGRRVVDMTLVVRSARLNDRPVEDAVAYWVLQAREADELWALDELFTAAGARWVADLGVPAELWHRTLAGLRREEVYELERDDAVVRRPFRIHRVRWVGT